MPELIIVVALLLLIGAIVVASRPRRPPAEKEDKPGAGDVLADERDAVAVAEPEPEAVEVPPAEPPAVVEAPPAEPEPVERLPRPTLRERLSKSRKFLWDRLGAAFSAGVDDETWEDVEAALIQADVGVETATKIAESLKEKARERRVTEAEELRGLLADELVALFDPERDRTLVFAPEGVTVWLVVGVNGSGKTTTIGKLAADLSARGNTAALAAADTFRAAADEQLEVWARRSRAELIKQQPGADPGAVAYDAFQHARAQGMDVLIVDTAGRLHTKTPLMDELAKIRRVIEKEGQVQEALLTIDATAGQNGLVQARQFAEAAGVSGVVLTKLDGTAKGGIALTIEDTLGIPIKLVGVGESMEDLQPFDPKTFVDALLA